MNRIEEIQREIESVRSELNESFLQNDEFEAKSASTCALFQRPPVEKNKIHSIGFVANFERFVKCFLTKKWGILIKKESGSLVFTGLKIPRNHKIQRRIIS